MADLLTQISAIFATPMGRGVLAFAVLSLLVVVLIGFWGILRLPRIGGAMADTFETEPPKVLGPRIARASSEDGFGEERPAYFRNAMMIIIAVGFGFILTFTARVVNGQTTAIKLASAAEGPSVENYLNRVGIGGDIAQTVSMPTGDDGISRHAQVVTYCKPSGSLTDRFVEVCEGGAAVRLDLMRLSYEGTFVLKPTWEVAAPTFVSSQSHAAPFGFAGDVTFAAPETVSAPEYDGYLVIGVAPEGEADVAADRARALRDFAIRKLSGGDRAQCLSEERVYTATATFNEDSVAALADQRAALAVLERAARSGTAADREAYEKAAADLAQAEFLFSEDPAPLVIGISTDPYSSNPDADMVAASERFLASYGAALQLKDASAVSSMRVCARGGVAR
ncbi:MAG: hypothetical protein AAGH41_04970 [Pseudomonadota bacterium]